MSGAVCSTAPATRRPRGPRNDRPVPLTKPNVTRGPCPFGLPSATTGEPTPIDHTETHGIHCRTFHIDPSGRLLVAAHIRPLLVREGANVHQVPACLSVLRIGNDGKLDFVRKYDVDVGGKTMFWMGMVQL